MCIREIYSSNKVSRQRLNEMETSERAPRSGSEVRLSGNGGADRKKNQTEHFYSTVQESRIGWNREGKQPKIKRDVKIERGKEKTNELKINKKRHESETAVAHEEAKNYDK